ncbi:CDC27 family protein [Alphaproteobacteria bacterium]|nr:CDC27 family protein [Alphaproteobacteria bacterium]
MLNGSSENVAEYRNPSYVRATPKSSKRLLRELDKLEKKKGITSDSLRQRGLIFYNNNNIDRAIFYLHKSMKKNSNLETLKALCIIHEKNNKSSRCETLFQKHIGDFCDSPNFWFLFGLLAAKKENWSEAIFRFNSAYERNFSPKNQNLEMLIKSLRNGEKWEKLYQISKKEIGDGNINLLTVEGFINSCFSTDREKEGTEFLNTTKYDWKKNSRLIAYAANLFYRVNNDIQELEGLNRLALSLDPDDVKIRWNLSLSQLRMGKICEGVENYKIRFDWEDFPSARRIFTKPRWSKDVSENSRIMIWTEQGIGDEIMFSSSIKSFSEIYPNLIFETHPKTVDIMMNSFPDVEVRPAIFNKKDFSPYIEDFEYHLPVGDLFCWMIEKNEELIKSGKSIPNTKYLKPDFLRKKYWEMKLPKENKKPNVGFCWSTSNLEKENKYKGFTKIEDWRDLLIRDDCNFVSIQYNFDFEDLDYELGDLRNYFVDTGFLDQMDDLEGALALISNLDLVITPGSSPYTIASACGVETWLYQNHSKFMLGRKGHFVNSPIFDNQKYYSTKSAFNDKDLVKDFNLNLDRYVADFRNQT